MDMNYLFEYSLHYMYNCIHLVHLLCIRSIQNSTICILITGVLYKMGGGTTSRLLIFCFYVVNCIQTLSSHTPYGVHMYSNTSVKV